MRHLLLATASVLCAALCLAKEAATSTAESGNLSRALIKEPTYQSTPKYGLMLLEGSGGDVAVWMVEDGKRLFIDKNANGDLTDDGPPIAPRNVRSVGAKGWDFDYILPEITPLDGSRHTSFQLRRW